MQVVRFFVGNWQLAFPVEAVAEVLAIEGAAAVFHAPRFLRGLIHVRGEAVPLLGLAPLFDLNPEDSPPGYGILVESGPFLAAFEASQPIDITELNPDAVADLPDRHPFLAAIDRAASVDGRLLLLLSPQRLFELEPLRQLREPPGKRLDAMDRG